MPSEPASKSQSAAESAPVSGLDANTRSPGLISSIGFSPSSVSTVVPATKHAVPLLMLIAVLKAEFQVL